MRMMEGRNSREILIEQIISELLAADAKDAEGFLQQQQILSQELVQSIRADLSGNSPDKYAQAAKGIEFLNEINDRALLSLAERKCALIAKLQPILDY